MKPLNRFFAALFVASSVALHPAGVEGLRLDPLEVKNLADSPAPGAKKGSGQAALKTEFLLNRP